ncbi:polysaccharide deacetylase family protein [uncultured Roseibium sp.]|uniref:polysaccharide deacetylase family protein n=1 Tax=uncultured Roseibium sp. TaxID=1936171 RepID=UPI00260230FA|nr:polysaccharide deacetylase family protein [uncultured Roseibium sp.]
MRLPWTHSVLPARPPSRWPGGQKVALWVAVGVETYREEGRTEDILPPGPAPDLVNISWRDYGNRVGAFRLISRLTGLGIRPALLLNTDVYDAAPEVIVAARDAGAEIVAHGHSNSDCLTEMTTTEEQDYIIACRDKISLAEGQAPGGWSSPWLQHRPTTLDHLERAGFRYVLDFRLDDQPVWLDAGASEILAIPYATELNDSTTAIGRFVTGTDFAEMIANECDELIEPPGDQAVVMSVVVHSFISGQPFRLRPLIRALEKMVARKDLWIATPGEIYAAVLANPDLAAGKGQP